MSLPPPSTWGLPYDSWRPGQVELLAWLLRRGPRFPCVTAPTGAGKSAVYTALAAIRSGTGAGGRTAVLTSSRGLQDQLARDFGAIVYDVRGASNYHCRAFDDGQPFARWKTRRSACDEGPCHLGYPCALKVCGCHYYDAIRAAHIAPIVVTNYAMWFYSYEYGDGLGAYDMLVMDEAHEAPDELSSFLTFELDAVLLARYRLGGPDAKIVGRGGGRDLDPWREWANSARSTVEGLIGARKPAGNDGGVNWAPLDDATEMRELKSLLTKLECLEAATGDWLWYAKSGEGRRRDVKLVFAPLWPAPYAERHLFRNTPRVVAVSATLRPKTMGLLGVGESEREFHETAHTFPVENRLVMILTGSREIATPRVQFNWTRDDQRAWVETIDRIVDGRLDRKGIVHTTSYVRAKLLVENSRHRRIMWTHWKGNTRERVEGFRAAQAPAVLVSPSMTTGYDFPADLCRYQIIGKIPFPDSTDPLTAARCDEDREYAYHLAMTGVVQTAGRPVRSETDWAETFIVDANASWFLSRHGHHAPDWFRDAVVWRDEIPEARGLDE